jgi:hypothetical protein
MRVDALEILKLAGGIAGIVALGWRAVDEFGSHLRVSIKVDGSEDDWITVLTTVENKGNRRKDISYALLLIGPSDENPLDTARVIAKVRKYGGTLRFTNDLAAFTLDRAEVHPSRAMIPISFYYREMYLRPVPSIVSAELRTSAKVASAWECDWRVKG